MARYAFSDLHGSLKHWQKIKEFVKPEDELYCLGDCGDRGSQSWETIKAVLSDPQVTYLKGNHEDMLVWAMYEYLGNKEKRKNCPKEYRNQSMIQLLAYNGGASTLEGWIKDGCKVEWVEKLENLPLMKDFVNEAGYHIILSHAGFTPNKNTPVSDFDLMWDRDHIYDNDWHDNDKTFIIHGHTPCSYLCSTWSSKSGSISYCNEHKLAIDMGTINSYTACLIDLDTFKEHLFFVLPEENE